MHRQETRMTCSCRRCRSVRFTQVSSESPVTFGRQFRYLTKQRLSSGITFDQNLVSLYDAMEPEPAYLD